MSLGGLLILDYYPHSKKLNLPSVSLISKRLCSFWAFLESFYFVLCLHQTSWDNSLERRSLRKLSTAAWWQSKILEYFLPGTWLGEGRFREPKRHSMMESYCSIFLLSANPGCHTNPSKTFTWNIYLGEGGGVRWESWFYPALRKKKKSCWLLYN